MKRLWLDSYAAGVPAEIHPVHRTLPALFEDACTRFAARPAFSAYGVRMDYATFDRLSRDLAAYFQQRLGLAPGERVLLMMPNQLAYPVALAAVLRAGLIAVNMSPMTTPGELAAIVEDAAPAAIVALDELAPVLARTPAAATLPLMLSRPHDLAGRQPSEGPDSLVHALLEGRGLSHVPPQVAADDIAFLQYTGGTTGAPKGAMLTHANLVANVEQNRVWSRGLLEEGHEVFLSALPYYHIYGLTINLLCGISIGALNVLVLDPRDFSDVVERMASEPVSVISGVSSMFDGLLATPGFCDLDFSTLRATYGGGMTVRRAVAEHWASVTGSPVNEGYGLTECSPTVSGNRHDLEAFDGTVGLPFPSTRVSLRDEEDVELGPDTPGELCVAGPQVMRGYWRREAASRNALTGDGYLRTGDIATIDARGYLRIVDRKKDVIIVSGFNVYPSEVERVVRRLPEVGEAACVGVEDERAGEYVKLYVEPAAGATISEPQLRDHCRRELTAYKVPRIIETRERLPRSPVGKVLKRDLRADSAGEGP